MGTDPAGAKERQGMCVQGQNAKPGKVCVGRGQGRVSKAGRKDRWAEKAQAEEKERVV